MSDLALYRKYRPQSFDDVVGQDSIVQGLKGSISQDSIAHAYLFAGSRGIGKTSIARIFAREIGTSPNDLYEIDAASNTGVDDVRQLNEAVATLPFESKYKVYILDEVHMVSRSAFNALLKTLEEPPRHVVFILATTEMHKVPDTVLSRCQVYQFKKPNSQVLKDLVLGVAKKEGYSLDPSSAELIALQGDGSFRDTLGALQKVLGSTEGKKVKAEDVERITGAPRTELVNALVNAVAAKDLEGALSAVRGASEANVEMKAYLKLVLMKMRYALLLRFSPGMKGRIAEELSEEDFKNISELAAKKEAFLNSAVLSELLGAYSSVGHSYIPELPLELALVKLLGKNEG